jgi:hypothetical protein
MGKEPILWQGHIFDSEEELYFAYWLEDLKKAGYIFQWIAHISSFRLTNGLSHTYTTTKQLKTKLKTTEHTQTLLKPSEYTPDFTIWWDKGEGVLYQNLSTKGKIEAPFIVSDTIGVSVVEIKPLFDQNNMTRLFVNNQKFMWDKHKIFVNMIHVTELFAETFTPSAYMFTKTGKLRKITKWKPRTLKQFLDDKR